MGYFTGFLCFLFSPESSEHLQPLINLQHTKTTGLNTLHNDYAVCWLETLINSSLDTQSGSPYQSWETLVTSKATWSCATGS